MVRPLGMDLTGRRFGKLVVLSAHQVPIGKDRYRTRWICLCDCGKEKIIDGSALLAGKTQTCNGCFRDLVSIGQQFGELTVLENVIVAEKKGNRSMWRCRCECGNEITVRGTTLLKDKKNCGKCLKSQDLTNRKFGKLIVLNPNAKNGFWDCVCDCGALTTVHYHNLLRGITQSCGCLSREILVARNKRNATHNMRNTRLYHIWDTMKARCYRSYSKDFKNYGARGISICEEWKSKFELFYEWAMENGYAEHLTIDRIDVNGNYEPSNCRWLTVKEQANNKRVNRYITIKGETKTIAEWSDKSGISQKALRYRIESGWSEDDLLVPVGVQKIYITIGDETKCINEWAREKGVSEYMIGSRYKAGIRGEALFENKRKDIFVEIEGVTKSLSKWGKENGIKRSTIWRRYRNGIRGKELIASPMGKKNTDQLSFDL
ncbi:hypothetical protein [Pseudoneobacillus sp. C159]